MGGQQNAAGVASVHQPVLVMNGEKDKMVPTKKTAGWCAGYRRPCPKVRGERQRAARISVRSRGVHPLGFLRHPELTVTVADVERLWKCCMRAESPARARRERKR